MAAEWNDPEILAALGEMFPIDPALLTPPRPRRNPIVSVGLALVVPCLCLLLMLAIHFVLVLRADHYVGERAIQAWLFLFFCALTTAVGALIVRD